MSIELIMLRRAHSPILPVALLTMMMLMGACKRATPPVSTTSPSQISSQPAMLATSTSIAPTAGSPYPPVTLPTPAAQTGEPYPEPSKQVQPTTEVSSPTPYPGPLPTEIQPPTAQVQASLTASPSGPTPTATETPPWMYPAPEVSPYPTSPYYDVYPGPIFSPYPTSAYTESYPGPINTPTTQAGQGRQATPTPKPTRTPSKSVTPTLPGGTGKVPSPTPYRITGTPGATPTELPPPSPISPPPAASSITIWHSWDSSETEVLRSIIRSFQRAYPDVTFTLTYIPLDDLESTYQEAAYLGQGPSLLLGPASWGPALYQQTVVTDLKPYLPSSYLADIIPAGLALGEYDGALISLPLSLHGTVMFRNSALISTAPTSMEDLISQSQAATHGGVVGSYLERGASFSAADIIGLGGSLVGEYGYPLFNDSYGVQWFDLLASYDEAGAVTTNTNLDQQMFTRGRVGIIIDDSRYMPLLAQAIGADNLEVDSWPTFWNGQLSGWVEADSVFLNANTTGDNRFAALTFIGYLLDPNVQMRLAEVGHIPSVATTEPRDRLIRQAMEAFLGGAPYPVTVDSEVLNLYWSTLDQAIQDVLTEGADPQAALDSAKSTITHIIRLMRSTP